jgi:hypothetical protein
MDSRFFYLGTGWKRMANFTLLPLYPRHRAPGTQWIGACDGLRAAMDIVEKRKSLTLPGLELRLLGHPASRRRSHSLYRLLCPGCFIILCIYIYIYLYNVFHVTYYTRSFFAVKS